MIKRTPTKTKRTLIDGLSSWTNVFDLPTKRTLINGLSRWTVTFDFSSVRAPGLYSETLPALLKRAPVTAATALLALALAGCGGSMPTMSAEDAAQATEESSYVIGAGDNLNVFVWGHNDLTTSVQVRPDGAISTPLVEDLPAAGKTPTELARSIEEVLSDYVRSPTVTVIVQSFVGEFARQIRVVGQAAQPQSLNYREGMTLLDVMIQVGGLSEFASGNRAKVVRDINGEKVSIRVRLKDLLNDGDINENIRMMPGDVLIIPESFF